MDISEKKYVNVCHLIHGINLPMPVESVRVPIPKSAMITTGKRKILDPFEVPRRKQMNKIAHAERAHMKKNNAIACIQNPVKITHQIQYTKRVS